MRILLAAGLLLAVAWLSLWLIDRRPARYRHITPAELRRMLRTLLDRGVDGGLFFLEVGGREKFVQLRKYVRAGRGGGIEIGFPITTWSEPFVAGVERELDRHGVRYIVQKTGSAPTSAFLIGDFGTDVEQAHRVVTSLVEEVFEADLYTEVSAYFRGLRPAVMRRPNGATSAHDEEE